MEIDPEETSRWIVDFHKQLVRGQHVLLYGNVADQFMFNGEYFSLSGLLTEYFTKVGYTLVGHYDIVDGLQFAEPGMWVRADDIVGAALGGAAVTPTAANSSGTIDVAVPPRNPPRASARGQRQRELLTVQALDITRRLLSQSVTSAAIVVDFLDKMISAPDRQAENELRLLVQLKKIIQEAALLRTEPLSGRRNSIVIVAGQLSSLPPWLYHENPCLSLIQVNRPRLEERKRFIESHIQMFYGGRGLSEKAVADTVRDFSDLTDGLTLRGLEGIRRMSLVERMSVTPARALVDFYKHGQRNDPWEGLDVGKIDMARKEISSRVIGQDAAVDSVVSMLIRARVGISLSPVTAGAGKPKGTFFFVGPTGVGKTELAKALTELIFRDDTAFARFDMSEYAEQHAAEKLAGAPPGFVGYDEGGHLSNRVREQPFSLLLFDEIEKAHGRVMDKFLQILEDGRLTDGKGQTAYFSQSVIIFTSNIGSDSLETLTADNSRPPSYNKLRRHYLRAVKRHFTRPPPEGLGRPELLNRLGDNNILVFDMLRPQNIDAICNKFLKQLSASALERRQIELDFRNGDVQRMIQRRMRFGDNMLYGGRRIKSLLEALIEQPLNRWVFFEKPPASTRVIVTTAPGGKELLFNGQAAPSDTTAC